MAITLRVEKSSRSPGNLAILGFLFGVFAFVAIIKTPIDMYEENKHAKWPNAVATITRETVRKIPVGSRGEWYIEFALRYSAGGEEFTANTRSRGGAFWEERTYRRWASRHPPGTSLPIRYDTLHHDVVVPDATDMPESGPQVADDLKMILFFSILSVVLVTFGRALRRRQANPC